jgi:hypothetical protein
MDLEEGGPSSGGGRVPPALEAAVGHPRTACLGSLRRWEASIGASTLRQTPHSLCTPSGLWRELGTPRDHGRPRAEENEIGVQLVAWPRSCPSASVLAGAMSGSAQAYRARSTTLIDDVDVQRILATTPRSGH